VFHFICFLSHFYSYGTYEIKQNFCEKDIFDRITSLGV
jgi:hypothetical protein